MKATQRLHDLGQSLWLDSISREILDDGTLRRYKLQREGAEAFVKSWKSLLGRIAEKSEVLSDDGIRSA